MSFGHSATAAEDNWGLVNINVSFLRPLEEVICFSVVGNCSSYEALYLEMLVK